MRSDPVSPHHRVRPLPLRSGTLPEVGGGLWNPSRPRRWQLLQPRWSPSVREPVSLYQLRCPSRQASLETNERVVFESLELQILVSSALHTRLERAQNLERLRDSVRQRGIPKTRQFPQLQVSSA